jgi:hypothetical protein
MSYQGRLVATLHWHASARAATIELDAGDNAVG